jgi:FimV-like protein
VTFSVDIQPELETQSGDISRPNAELVSKISLESREALDTIDDQASGFSADDAASEVEIATKLELAYAYSKMGDMDSVRKILGEVVGSANETQRVEAENLMKGLLESDNTRDNEE